jgi:hypothetical protein
MADRKSTMTRKRWPDGYFFVVDGEGAEVPGSRRSIPSDMPHEEAVAIRQELERGAALDCSVEFREI